jgi:hypothetical protein
MEITEWTRIYISAKSCWYNCKKSINKCNVIGVQIWNQPMVVNITNCSTFFMVCNTQSSYKFSEAKVDRLLVSVLCLLNYTFMLNTYSPSKCCEKVTVPFLDYLHVLKPWPFFFATDTYTIFYYLLRKNVQLQF